MDGKVCLSTIYKLFALVVWFEQGVSDMHPRKKEGFEKS